MLEAQSPPGGFVLLAAESAALPGQQLRSGSCPRRSRPLEEVKVCTSLLPNGWSLKSFQVRRRVFAILHSLVSFGDLLKCVNLSSEFSAYKACSLQQSGSRVLKLLPQAQ